MTGPLKPLATLTTAALCLLALSLPTARAATVPASRIAGINAQFLPPASDPPAREVAFARIRALGVSAARIDADWAAVERRPGVYDWSPLDAKVNELVANGLEPEIILDYGNTLYSRRGRLAEQLGFTGIPPFAIGAPVYFPPDSPQPFARWAAAVASRYRQHVRLLEVWNEENLGWRFWEPHEDPAAYAALLKATYRAVKTVAPEDQVALGGTFYPAIDTTSAAADGIPVPTATAADEIALPHQGTLDFLAHAFAAQPDLGRYFDAVAYHPYHFPYMAPEVDIPIEGSTERSMVAVRRLLDRHGLANKPIWITEVGWPNNTLAYGPSPQKSASYLVRTFATAWSHGIDDIFWYCYGDGSDWQYDQESAFGIVDSSGHPKPAYYAWLTLDRLLAALPYRGSARSTLELPPDGHALSFGAHGRTATVVWLAPETMFTDQGLLPSADQRVNLPTPRGTTAILDMTGHALRVGATFQASPYPVYLIEQRTSPSRARGTRRRREVAGGPHARQA
jgi:hypothetical protein